MTLSVFITLYKTYIDPFQITHWFEALNWGNFKIIRGYFSLHTPHLIPITAEAQGIIIILEQGYAMAGKTVPEQNCRINLNQKSEKSSSYRNKVIQWNSLTRFLSTISAALSGMAGLNRSCLDFQYRCKLLARLSCVKIFRNVNHVNNNISSKYKGSWQHVKIPPASPPDCTALCWAKHESFQASLMSISNSLACLA